MNKATTIAVDIAKRSFSVYSVNAETGEIATPTLTRRKFEEFVRRRAPSVVVLEAGGSAQYWGRSLTELGHEVHLIAPQHVRPFVRTNKTDGADARAIWEAAQRPEVKWVVVKSEMSQAVLALHRMRAQLCDMRKMQGNQLKALLYEFGVVARGKITFAMLDEWFAAGRVPQLLEASLREQIERIARLKRDASSSKTRPIRSPPNCWRCPALVRSRRVRLRRNSRRELAATTMAGSMRRVKASCRA